MTPLEEYCFKLSSGESVVRSLKTFQFDDGKFYFRKSAFQFHEGDKRVRAEFYNKLKAVSEAYLRTVELGSSVAEKVKNEGENPKGGLTFIRVDTPILKEKVTKKS